MVIFAKLFCIPRIFFIVYAAFETVILIRNGYETDKVYD